LQAAVLKQEPGAALCDACLAFACSTTLIEVRPITDSLLAKSDGFQRGRFPRGYMPNRSRSLGA